MNDFSFPFRSVTILSQYYAPEPGAPQIRLRALVDGLRRADVAVRVITGMPNYPEGRIFDGYRGRLYMEDEVDGVPVTRVWLYPAAGRGSGRRLLNYLSFTATSLLPLLMQQPPDLVFVEAQPITLALPAYLLKQLRGVPYVYNTPDLQIEHAEEADWLPAPGLVRMARGLEGFLMRQALSTTTVTHAFVRHFIETYGLPPDSVTFLPNGADTDRLRPRPYDDAYAARFGVTGKKVFTFAGTHAPYQGLEVLVEAAELLQHRDDVALLLVGKGPMRQPLIDAVREKGLTNVVFGDSPFEEMEQLMSITYASLVALRDQGTARMMRLSKTIPPLACGVPVLFAGHGESADIVDRAGCGVHLPPERPDRLAEAIEALADDPERRDRMGRAGRALAEEAFSWRAIVDDWMRQMAAVAEGRPPRIPSLSLAPQASAAHE